MKKKLERQANLKKPYMKEVIEGRQSIKTVQNTLTKKFPHIKDFPVAHNISIFEKGSMVGDNDALSKDNLHSSTLTCYSQKGKLLAMPKESFLKLCKIGVTWGEIAQ